MIRPARTPRRRAHGKTSLSLTHAVGELISRPARQLDNEADPSLCGTPRISTVATEDRGAGNCFLFPNEIILVAPIDRFIGTGIYQLEVNGALIVRFAFMMNPETIRMDPHTRAGTDFFDVTPALFDEMVVGLVVAGLRLICRRTEWQFYKSRNRELARLRGQT